MSLAATCQDRNVQSGRAAFVQFDPAARPGVTSSLTLRTVGHKI